MWPSPGAFAAAATPKLPAPARLDFALCGCQEDNSAGSRRCFGQPRDFVRTLAAGPVASWRMGSRSGSEAVRSISRSVWLSVDAG